MKNTKKRALTAYEDTNMYGGAHCTNIDAARKAAREGRDLIIHASHYDGQRYHASNYRVTDICELDGGRVVGTIASGGFCGEPWSATVELCEYARTGRM